MTKPFRLAPQQATEEQEQSALAKYLDMKRLHWCHVPNGGERNVIVAAKLKAQGVKRGVPDVMIFDPPPRHPDKVGVAIELKRRAGGVVSTEQERWLTALSERGWLCEVCRGWEEAVSFLKAAGF